MANEINVKEKYVVGIIGDKPSVSAKSPRIWNAVFKDLKLDAVYLPFDTSLQDLPGLVKALKENEKVLGFNVTMPYKIEVMPHLDIIDDSAREVGAVNTVFRDNDGKLIGSNTDGQGALDSLIKTMPGEKSPFLKSMVGFRVLLIGGGGAARSVAFFVADAIGSRGTISITTRDAAKAKDLAEGLNKKFNNANLLLGGDLGKVDLSYDLVINASTVGQMGIRKLSNGGATCLQPYSPLAAAHPPIIPPAEFSDDKAFYAVWNSKSAVDVARNNAESEVLIGRIPVKTAFFDVIFSPTETVFLAQARKSGKRTLNGKGMNLAQAAEGFVRNIMKAHLQSKKIEPDSIYERVLEGMAKAW